MSSILATDNLPFLITFAVTALFGLINCFWGFRIFKVILMFWGFLAGLILGLMAGSALAVSAMISLIMGLIGGFLGIFLVRMLFNAGVAALGGFFGYSVALAILYHRPDLNRWLVIITACLLCGLAALAMKKSILIVITAFSGSWLTVSAGASLILGKPFGQVPLSSPDIPDAWLWISISWAVLGFLGMMVQFMRTGRGHHI